ncbi:hypothetical protein GCM10022402_37960 [Salinactinospora qingdaonensis]|uniref:Uncharacterized protein n=1 Tax=Salinactinospora qingdaonensis TaxID=702744 RepID=A0ABP7G4S1_9ACTN
MATLTSSASASSRAGPRFPGLRPEGQDVVVQMDIECDQKGVQVRVHSLSMGALRHVRSRFGKLPSTI